ncbi:MAG: Hsp20/alpha crystallin family protein [Candidatus Kuenenbacteria bacterium]
MSIFKKTIIEDDSEREQIDIDVEKKSDAQEVKPKCAKQEERDLSSIDWFGNSEEVGELSVDVYEKGDKIIIKSTVAGVLPEDIEVMIDEDTITIRGKRKQEEHVNKEDYFYQECYWGGFERILKLPAEVQEEGAEAVLRNGVLTVSLLKIKKFKSVVVPVKL